jgi:hypothetical protein
MEFIEKEEEQVRRKSSVNERAMSLAQQHRRYSMMSEQGRMYDDPEKKASLENGKHDEEV